jgi:hypothetical protein
MGAAAYAKPRPCLFMDTSEVALSKAQKAWLQGKPINAIEHLPEPTVRASRVHPNEQARAHGFLLFESRLHGEVCREPLQDCCVVRIVNYLFALRNNFRNRTVASLISIEKRHTI